MSPLPKNWREEPLGKLGQWIGGGTPSKSNPKFWTNGTVPWVSPKDMKTPRITDAADHITPKAVERSATNLVGRGSVLIVVRSGILKHTFPVAVADREVALNQDLKAVTPREDISSDYLALALKAFEREILHSCTKNGVTVQSIVLPVFLRFKIPVAPLVEQRRITAEVAKQFTRLDAGVVALQRVQANLKRYRAAILMSASEGRLVDGGPKVPRDKAAGQLISRLVAERRAKWPERKKFKEPLRARGHGLPPLPADWAWATIDQLAAPEPNSVTDGPFGSNLKTSHYTDSGPRVLRLQNIGDGVFVDERAHISKTHYARLLKHQIFPGDLVIAGLSENPPRACIIPDGLGPTIVKADCIRFKPHPLLNTKYLNIALNSESVRGRMKSVVHGVGRPRLNLGEIRSIELPVPPISQQAKIVAEVERHLSIVDELEELAKANMKRAASLRKSILQRAFSGNL